MKRYLFPFALLLLMLLTACGSAGSTTQRLASTPTSSAKQVANCSTQMGQWTPVGKTWKLNVTFKTGPRAGQEELSYMTFLASGGLTATFPSPTQGQPDLLPPAREGRWCASGGQGFVYTFKDPILANGHMVAYIQPAITALMTGPSTYTGTGVGVGWQAATAMPLPQQYGDTVTTAIAV